MALSADDYVGGLCWRSTTGTNEGDVLLGITEAGNLDTTGSVNIPTGSQFKINGTNIIGSAVQAYHANLGALAGLTGDANKIPYFTAVGAMALITSSANMVSLLGSADYDTARTNLGLAIGTHVQAYNANLTTYAGIAPSASAQVALEHAADGVVLCQRHRVTTAEANAGHELLPAITGHAYRIVNAKAIAYGGSAATCTTVDITGTQSSAVVKLCAFAQAGLVQSAVLTMGDASSAVLADGASYAACDAATAINVSVTTNNLATATGIDFIIEYVVV